MKLNIKEIYVYMLTIGKISEENLNFMDTLKNNVLTGGQDHLFQPIKMVAHSKINVSILMDGKSKNIIQITIN